MQELSGEAHAFLVGEPAADEGLAVNFRPFDALDLEADKPVIHKDRIAGDKLLRQTRIADAHDVLVADELPGGEGERRAVGKVDPAGLKRADAVFRTFRVEHDGDGQTQLFADLFDHVDLFLVLFVRAVRKVQARDVQPRAAHGGERFFIVTGGTDGTDDLGFSHGNERSFQALRRACAFSRRSRRAKVWMMSMMTGITVSFQFSWQIKNPSAHGMGTDEACLPQKKSRTDTVLPEMPSAGINRMDDYRHE